MIWKWGKSGRDDAGSAKEDGRSSMPISDMEDPAVQNPATVARNEKLVREKFWPKLRRVFGRVPFVDDLLAAYYAAIDPETPMKVKAVLLASLAYFIVPADLIPDIIAALGFTDDASVLAMAIALVSAHIKDKHRKQAAEALGREFPDHPEADPDAAGEADDKDKKDAGGE